MQSHLIFRNGLEPATRMQSLVFELHKGSEGEGLECQLKALVRSSRVCSGFIPNIP